MLSGGLSGATKWHVHDDTLDSDHFPIDRQLNTKYKTVTQRTISRWKLSSAHWTIYKEKNKKLNINFKNTNINKANENIKELTSICNETIPKTKAGTNKKSRHLPWLTPDCTKAMKGKKERSTYIENIKRSKVRKDIRNRDLPVKNY